jgi:O-antigen/teichoic acid export membrane protein
MRLEELRQKAIRGAVAKLCGQGVLFGIRLGFLVLMARLLDPADFGLVAMVTVVTGIYDMFANGGLSSATIQKEIITDEQISTLFWINVFIGGAIGILCVATAPILIAFYHEPRLSWIAAAFAAGFFISGAGVQHMALLMRQMRYELQAAIEILSSLVGVVIGILMAVFGFGYWALVAAAITPRVVLTASTWLATLWVPGRPRRTAEVRTLLSFGGTITLEHFVTYVGYNFEKALLGRVWGADALGLYGRAFQLVELPAAHLTSAIGGVTLSALSRMQKDTSRIKRIFLQIFAIINAMTIPATIFCAVFADEIVLVVLGAKWVDATTILRLLTPAILVFGMTNPIGLLLQAIGFQTRTLWVACATAPVVILACVLAMPYGPNGVALAFSCALVLLLVPRIVWLLHGVGVSASDLFFAVWRSAVGGIAAVGLAFAAAQSIELQPLGRLVVGGAVMGLSYACLLLFAMGQKEFYLSLLRELFAERRPV